jgi:hypothetical protein
VSDDNNPQDAPPPGSSPPSGAGASFFERARLAREQAATKAGELANKAGARAGELKDQVASRAGEVKDQVAQKANEVRDAGTARVGEMLDEFNAALPVIREAGYGLVKVEIQLGLPPKFVATFGAPVDATEERTAALLEKHGENKIAVMVLKALEVQTRFKIAGLKPSGLEIELGLTPHVTVRFG